jgi:major membrane immunogen (membrane-anchored lipoprotein)
MRKNNFKLGFIICLMLLLAACGNENPNTDMSSNETINNSTTDINVHGTPYLI